MFSEKPLSRREKHAQYAIREMFPIVEGLEAKGKKIAKVNIGDPVKYFPTPKYIVEAYRKALKEGRTGYGRSPGERIMQKAIVKRYKRQYKLNYDEDDVFVTQGLSEGIQMINKALVHPGHGGVLFAPYYPTYKPLLELEDGKAVLVECDEENGWHPDVEDLRKKIKKAEKNKVGLKYLLVINPNNPTGAVIERKELCEIADIANEHDLLLIGDEIYDEIIFSGKLTSVGEIAKGQPHLVLNGMSKVWNCTGFRIGWVIAPEKDAASEAFKDAFTRLGTLRLCPSMPAQHAGAEALNNRREHKKFLSKFVPQLKKQSEYCWKRLNEINGVFCAKPKGAFYIFPRVNVKKAGCRNDVEFAKKLLEKERVWAVQGSGFGSPGHLRIVTLPHKQVLDRAVDGISALLK